MLSDWELWACARKIMDEYPDCVWDQIFDRICTLRERGDEAGVDTWWAIADKVQVLMEETCVTVFN